MDQPQTNAALLTLAQDWHAAGRATAIAVVVQTWGSAPRPAGSLLVIDADGAMQGSVSGGCVEGAVVAEAIDALGDGMPRLLDYGVSDDSAFAVGLACGGQIQIMVLPIGAAGFPARVLTELVARLADHTPTGFCVTLPDGAARIIDPASAPDRFVADKSGVDDATFYAVLNPPLRMIIVGAVQIAQALVPMAQACGFDVVVIDPRSAFGAAARFPGQVLLEEWPDTAVAALQPDTRTAIVTLTHDAKLDDPALMAAFATDAFYIGCLGSTRTHAKRVERLTDAGISADTLSRIHAPIGLNIGAKSPSEIAVSIIAQVTQVLRQKGN